MENFTGGLHLLAPGSRNTLAFSFSASTITPEGEGNGCSTLSLWLSDASSLIKDMDFTTGMVHKHIRTQTNINGSQ